MANTPDLEPCTDSDSDSDSDCEDDDDEDAQYVYIPADSPFHRGLPSPSTSAYASFTGFPFACDALAEEDPLFVKTPGAWFDEDVQDIVDSGDDVDSGIVVWDSHSSETHSQLNWSSPKLREANLFSEHARRSPMVFDDDVCIFSLPFVDLTCLLTHAYL